MLGCDLQILRIINESNNISERFLAEKTNISLGKVNTLLKNIVENKYVNIKIIDNKNVIYELTSLGINILENSLDDIKNTKLKIHRNEFYKVREAVILAAGSKLDFEKPVGFLEIEGIKIIQRIIDCLKYNGIEKIIIVTGYKKEFYEELAKKDENIICIDNPNYKWTGTMSSLAQAREFITDDFLLVENDLIFENRAIEQLLKNTNRDCILLTNESGSGDEAFVEIRNGYLFKMSKDIHQFNRIDGEMIGINKISLKLYEMMLEEFKHNVNPYMNYEYTMMDVARNFKVGYEKINNLVWGEIDDKKQYINVKKHIVPMIRRKEMQYKINIVKNAIIEGLNVCEEDIYDICSLGGMTNKNYKAKVKDDYYVIRIPGIGTDSMINRYDEMINSKMASNEKIDADILFFDYLKGIKITKLIKGAETLNPATARKQENMELVVGILKNLHESNMDMKNRFDVFEKIEEYEEIVKKNNGKLFDDYYLVKEDIKLLQDVLKENVLEIVPCHNDTVAENFIKDVNGKMFLIDWEYSGLNDPMWDLAAHCQECGFSDNDEELLLKLYFRENINEYHRIRILIYKICQDFLWSLWTVLKEAQGDDFGTYGHDRYCRAKKNLGELKNLLIEKN